MKSKLLAILILSLIKLTSAIGQSDCLDSLKYKEVYMKRTQNIIGFVPSKSRITNGWAIGWSSSLDDYCINMDSIRINGLHTNISPFQTIIAGMVILMAPFRPRELMDIFIVDTLTYKNLETRHKVNGVSIGLFEFGESFSFQGLHITGLFHNVDKINGVTVTSLGSENKHLNGVMISALYNKTSNGKGLQIGLINSANKFNGLQIGLWNRIGKRAFPIMNMKFDRKRG